MKLNANIMKLITLLEYRVGNNVYNPNSYDGWTGKYGCSFRYPVTYEYMNEDVQYEYKTSGMMYDLTEKNIGSVRYKFGSNHLYIGDALVEVLDLLEKRYNLDFEQLEEEVADKESSL